MDTFENSHFVLYREVFLSSEVKVVYIVEKGHHLQRGFFYGVLHSECPCPLSEDV